MRLDDGRVVPNFIRQALQGEPLTVYDDGMRTRSFCYVADLVEGMNKLLMSAEVFPVNLGNPREMTILDFARKVLEVTGSSSEIVFVRPRDERTQDDPMVRQPDITRARETLDWEPMVSLEEGLAKTVAFFANKLGN
jgi:dTDP-glucose 4,6-dehydratase